MIKVTTLRVGHQKKKVTFPNFSLNLKVNFEDKIFYGGKSCETRIFKLTTVEDRLRPSKSNDDIREIVIAEKSLR